MTQAQPRIPFELCPLCASKILKEIRNVDCRSHPLYHPIIPDKMIWLKCQTCEHCFTDGYFTQQALSVIFRKTHPNQYPGHDIEVNRAVSARIVERVSNHVKSGKWLDVGFGNGSLLFTAEEFGFEAIGFDLRSRSVEDMKNYGIKAYCVDLLDWKDQSRINVISMADVLEHMPYPRKALAKAYQLLHPGGVLFISLPNYDCSAWRVLDKSRQNPYWMEIEHYHNFSRKRLLNLLEEEGFEFVTYAVSERYRLGMEVIARKPNSSV